MLDRLMLYLFMEDFLQHSNEIEGVKDRNSRINALEAWSFLWHEQLLNVSSILECHRILMTGHLKKEELGVFRSGNVFIGGRKAPLPITIQNLMDDFLRPHSDKSFSNKKFQDKFSQIDALKRHREFEMIHPFWDGNGRIGRILYAWECFHCGFSPIAFNASNRQGYYGIFRP